MCGKEKTENFSATTIYRNLQGEFFASLNEEVSKTRKINCSFFYKLK